jgi:hypothetical protein
MWEPLSERRTSLTPNTQPSPLWTVAPPSPRSFFEFEPSLTKTLFDGHFILEEGEGEVKRHGFSFRFTV